MKYKESFLVPHYSGFNMWRIAEDNGDDYFDIGELISEINSSCEIIEWEDWLGAEYEGEDPRGNIYNEDSICWIRPVKLYGDTYRFACILAYPVSCDEY